jgi:hypothetical protein
MASFFSRILNEFQSFLCIHLCTGILNVKHAGADVKNAWSYKSTPPPQYVFMEQYAVKRSDITFTVSVLMLNLQLPEFQTIHLIYKREKWFAPDRTYIL